MIMKKHNSKIILLWILAVIVNIKSIFCDFGDDQAYALSTSFRHIMGDGLFQEMCEPHQTSSFLCDFLMIIYKYFVPDLEGVALYLQVCGVLLYAVVTWILYKELVHFVRCEMAHYMCVFFFVVRAKHSIFPEFSNMQIGFSVLLFVFLLKFFRNQNNIHHLILAAFFFCLEVLSYPTCLLVFAGVLGLLYVFGEKRWKDIAIFVGTCAICGGAYLALIVSRIGFEALLKTLRFITYADKSHSGSVFGMSDYFGGVAYGLVWIIVVAFASYIIYLFLKKKVLYLSCFGCGLLLTEILMTFVAKKSTIDWREQYFVILLLIICLGCRGKHLRTEIRPLYYAGMVISLLSTVSVAFLTNLSLLAIMGYLILGAMVSFVSIDETLISKQYQAQKSCNYILPILLLFLFHRLMFIGGYANEDGIKLVNDMENIIRVGPTKGIAASLQKCNEVRGTISDWERFVKEDSVLVVVPWMLDSVVYVNRNTEVSTFSTIDTPTYDESLLDYWSEYPEKTPTVIAVEGWGREISVNKDTWIMKWIEENYTSYENGEFWRFYRKE